MKTIEQQYIDGDVSLGFYAFETGIAGNDFDHFLKREYVVLESEAWRHASSGYPEFKCFLPKYNQKLAELCIQALKQYNPNFESFCDE